jgi:hypothetical protein
MNIIENNGLKVLVCALAALVITVAMSFSFVHSTELVRTDDHLPMLTAKLTAQPSHIWFGQAVPAVLVD